MKTRWLAAVMILVCCAAAQAQDYSIRIAHRSNLRTSHSLNAEVAETAPAGAILQVVGQAGRWFKINRDGSIVWMAAWLDHSRVDDGSQEATQTGATADIDNCCFVDRQCQSDPEWADGYWAFQNGQCAAPAPSQSGRSGGASGSPAGPIDNCCFAGWSCVSDQQWLDGFYAYQNNQCQAPSQSRGGQAHVDSCCQLGWNCAFDFDFIMGRWWYKDAECNMPMQELVDGVILEGSRAFINQHRRAMNLIKTRAPEWYAYTINIIKKIRESNEATGYGTLHKSFNVLVWHSAAYAAAIIIHETCHVHRSYAGVHTNDFENIAEEAICDQVAIDALNQISPGTAYPRARIESFFRLGLDFDIGPSVQREWDRARHIFAQAS